MTAYKRMAWPSAMPLIAIAAILLCCAVWTVKQLNERLSPMLASAPRGFTSWIAELISERLSPIQASALGGMKAESYVKNDHTNQTIRVDRGRYDFSYVFRDHKQRDWRWDWAFEQALTRQDIDRFGLPVRYRQADLEHNLRAGMVRLTNGTVDPDFAALIPYYKPYTRHLYDMARDATRNDSREELVRFLLAFVQDIPYGIPPDTVGKKMILGILTPPQVFVEGWGDCDTKSLLLATILAHDTSIGLLLISVPGHMLVAIEGIPRPYQQIVRHRGKTYLLAEPTGPRRSAIGETAMRYNIQKIEQALPHAGSSSTANPVASGSAKSARVLTGKAATVVSERESRGLLDLRLATEPGRKFAATLAFEGHFAEDRAIAQPLQGGSTQVLARLTNPGDYTVEIFMDNPGRPHEYRHVLSYPFSLANAAPASPPFPKTYQSFQDSQATLQSPLDGQLKPGQRVHFRLSVPNAEKVFIQTGGAFVALNKAEQSFSGDITVKRGYLLVLANTPVKDEFRSLMKYRVE